MQGLHASPQDHFYTEVTLAWWPVVVTKANSRGSPKFFAGCPWEDKCKFSCVFSRYYFCTHKVSLSIANNSTPDMMHSRSCLADMQHTGEKGLKSTSHTFGQVLSFTMVQTLAKALFGCEVFVDVGFHILVPIVCQLLQEHGIATVSSISPTRQEKGKCRSNG